MAAICPGGDELMIHYLFYHTLLFFSGNVFTAWLTDPVDQYHNNNMCSWNVRLRITGSITAHLYKNDRKYFI